MKRIIPVVALVAGLISVAPQSAQADRINITRTDDPAPGNCEENDCSLREGIIAANKTRGLDQLLLPAGRFRLTRGGDGENAAKKGDLDITSSIDVIGRSAGDTIVDANGLDRAFDVRSNGDLLLRLLTVTGGEHDSEFGGGVRNAGELECHLGTIRENTAPRGGGISNENGKIHLASCRVQENTASNRGGGVYFADGDAVFRRTTLANNSAPTGGGLFQEDGHMLMEHVSHLENTSTGDGAGMALLGNTGLTLLDSNKIRDNTSSRGAGGGIYSEVSVNVHQSELTDNSAGDEGGGLALIGPGVETQVRLSLFARNTAKKAGGGIYNQRAAVKTGDSTFSGNKSRTSGGGVYTKDGTTNIVRTTVALNIADSDNNGTGAGGGLFSDSSTVDYSAAIIASNNDLSGNTSDNCSANTVSVSYNIFHPSTGGCELDAKDNIDDPDLGALDNNGGESPTHAVPENSPAKDFVPTTAGPCKSPFEDQRGVPRPQFGECDAGGYEYAECANRIVNRVSRFQSDKITGTPGNDGVLAQAGNDKISTGDGNDGICAGEGNDVVNGGDGDDTLLGEEGNDKLRGGPGHDKCIGGGGTDTFGSDCEIKQQ